MGLCHLFGGESQLFEGWIGGMGGKRGTYVNTNGEDPVTISDIIYSIGCVLIIQRFDVRTSHVLVSFGLVAAGLVAAGLAQRF
jgi:hypothetical protein